MQNNPANTESSIHGKSAPKNYDGFTSYNQKCIWLMLNLIWAKKASSITLHVLVCKIFQLFSFNI